MYYLFLVFSDDNYRAEEDNEVEYVKKPDNLAMLYMHSRTAAKKNNQRAQAQLASNNQDSSSKCSVGINPPIRNESSQFADIETAINNSAGYLAQNIMSGQNSFQMNEQHYPNIQFTNFDNAVYNNSSYNYGSSSNFINCSASNGSSSNGEAYRSFKGPGSPFHSMPTAPPANVYSTAENESAFQSWQARNMASSSNSSAATPSLTPTLPVPCSVMLNPQMTSWQQNKQKLKQMFQPKLQPASSARQSSQSNISITKETTIVDLSSDTET